MPAYRPLSSPESWAGAEAAVDEVAFAGDAGRLAGTGAWSDMVRRGALLAAAYRSGALACLYEADAGLAGALLAGVAGPQDCGAAGPHVVAIYEALLLAAGASPSAPWLAAVHATACRPQVTAAVATDHGPVDHVLGHGDLKHHPNDAGGRTFAPVAVVEAEAAALVRHLAAGTQGHPLVAAAYALHAVVHVGAFAAGNGRVARVVASVPLLAAGGPLLVDAAAPYRAALDAAENGHPGALVAYVQRCWAALAGAVEAAAAGAGQPEPSAALRRWEAQADAARRLHAALAAAAGDALGRHRRRPDLGWLPDLAAAEVVPVPAGGVALRVPAGDGATVEERLAVDAHPLDRPDAVAVAAEEAGLRLDVPVEGAPGRELEALVDRAVTALALRVAAEAEPD